MILDLIVNHGKPAQVKSRPLHSREGFRPFKELGSSLPPSKPVVVGGGRNLNTHQKAMRNCRGILNEINRANPREVTPDMAGLHNMLRSATAKLTAVQVLTSSQNSRTSTGNQIFRSRYQQIDSDPEGCGILDDHIASRYVHRYDPVQEAKVESHFFTRIVIPEHF